MRRHQRQPEFAGEVGRRRDQGLLLRMAGALDFQVEGVREHRRPGLGAAFGEQAIAGQQRLADVAEGGARQRDEAVGADLLQHQPRDFGAAAGPRRQLRAGQNLAQLQVAGMVAAEQQQARRPVGVGLVRQPDIGAEHRLDALAARRAVELDEAEEVAEVGQGQRRHAVAGGARHRVIDTDDTVGDGVLAVQAKMDEAWVGHRRWILLLHAAPPATNRRRQRQWIAARNEPE